MYLEGEQRLDFIFHALSNSTRRAIMSMICTQAKTVTDIASEFKFSLNAVSKHLKILERASLLTRVKKGREYYCQVNPVPLSEAQDFINFYSKFWNEKLDNLEYFLETKENKNE